MIWPIYLRFKKKIFMLLVRKNTMPLGQYRKNCTASQPAKGQIRFQTWTSLVVQQLRIRLPTQKTWVRSLVQGDSTRCGTSKPMGHNHWPCALETMRSNCWNSRPRALLGNSRSHSKERPSSKAREEHPLSPRHLLQLEKACVQQQRLSAVIK